ncbi:MAG: ATP cone domain-containing protein [Patescibacteria group bacterium]
MANFIIKRDGKKEPFYIGKIKRGIVEAALKTDMQEKNAENLAEQISQEISYSIRNANEVLAAELTARVVSALDAVAPQVAKIWKKYQEIF